MGPGLLVTTIAQAVIVAIALIQGYEEDRFGNTYWDIHVGWLVAIGLLGLVQLFVLIGMGFAIDKLLSESRGAGNREPGRQPQQPSSPSLDMPTVPLHRREAAVNSTRRALAAAADASAASYETAATDRNLSRAAKQAAETALSAVSNLRAMANSGSEASFQDYLARTDSAADAANDAAKAAREAIGKG